MGIANRTLDATEQKEQKTFSGAAVVNGKDLLIGVIERPQTLVSSNAAMLGVSGSPCLLLKVARFINGTGGSTFLIGSTFAITTYATSGWLSMSMPAAGSTVLNLQKGDVLMAVQGGGTGAASDNTIIEVVLQNTQDFKTWF